MIDSRRPVSKVTALGEFWRILLPGTYTLKVILIFIVKIYLKKNAILGSLSRLSDS